VCYHYIFFYFSSRRRHTRFSRDWSSDVCSSDLEVSQRRLRVAPFEHELAEQPMRLRERATRLVAVILDLTQRQRGPRDADPQLEIGRASCRERANMLEVLESLKKQATSCHRTHT